MKRKIVVFRVWRGNTGVLALFPHEQADNAGHVNSYEHVGQHGGASYALCIASTRPAMPQEYADLQAELESIGYVLDIRKRAGRARKTEDEYQVHGFYSGTWEEVTCEDNRREALARLREYRENEPSTAFKLVKRRIKLSDAG